MSRSSASCGWRNRALSSKLILASSAMSSPAFVTTSGLISTRLQSRLTNSCASACMNFSAERTLAPLRSSFAAQLADLVRLQAGVGAERFLEDQLGRFFGDFFDVHAAGAGGHQHGQAGGAVDDDAEVQLAGDVAAGFDEHAADGLAFGAGLDRDELVVRAGCRRLWRLLRRLRTSCTPCCLGLSLIVPLPRPPAWIWAFTTASGPPSCLNAAAASSAVVATMLLRHGDAGFAQQLLGLVFVDLHPATPARLGELRIEVPAIRAESQAKA